MSEIEQIKTAERVQYLYYQWGNQVDTPRSSAGGAMTALGASWQALETMAADPDADSAAVEVEALRLVSDTLTAHRAVMEWFTKGTVLPGWTVEDGHVVLGTHRIPLTGDLLEKWMRGETS
ncbi:hypothetical protein AB0J30_08880 [Streptomyces microflavus]|uniref:hypothetical protein n=1 Tax=Streptomyces microflavus TaxID=1919 RepID=UPI00342CF66E